MRNQEKLILELETMLGLLYGFTPVVSALDHLIQKDKACLLTASGTLPRGAVFFSQIEEDDTVDIGFYIHPDLWQHLSVDDPLVKLHTGNLDSFCVLIEELSHFHLLLNRAQERKQLRLIELEWQGEIDKVLLSAKILMDQTGSPCLMQLTRLIFDQGITVAENQKLYDDAVKYAAKSCFKLLEGSILVSSPFKLHSAERLFRKTYPAVWDQKLEILKKKQG